jgi:PadR family transcriptional regulator, regulatory protein PadR
MEHQQLLAGLVWLHILHHAAEGDILRAVDDRGAGPAWLSDEPRHPVPPLLHGMEEKGYLQSRQGRTGRSVRRLYQATPLGRDALALAREKVRELFGEIFAEP